MSDYISRDAVLAYPIRLNHYDKEHGNVHFVYGVESVMEYVKSLPAADVAPVVRCKDCKHGEADDPDCPSKYYCRGGCGWNKADFYCAYGK